MMLEMVNQEEKITESCVAWGVLGKKKNEQQLSHLVGGNPGLIFF